MTATEIAGLPAPGWRGRPTYRRLPTGLRGDLLAGVTMAAYLVSQVMAYPTVADVPSVAGCGGGAGYGRQLAGSYLSGPGRPGTGGCSPGSLVSLLIARWYAPYSVRPSAQSRP